MSKYQIATLGDRTRGFIRRETKTNPYSNYEYFCGYDFMGSAQWKDRFSFDYEMTIEEAKHIIHDLEAADM